MKSFVIVPKSADEYTFLAHLMKKLGVNASVLSEEEMEDIILAGLLKKVDKTKKVSRSAILKKLAD